MTQACCANTASTNLQTGQATNPVGTSGAAAFAAAAAGSPPWQRARLRCRGCRGGDWLLPVVRLASPWLLLLSPLVLLAPACSVLASQEPLAAVNESLPAASVP